MIRRSAAVPDLEWTYKLIQANYRAVVTQTASSKNDPVYAFRVCYLPPNWEAAAT